MQELRLLDEKLEQLLKKYTALQAENSRLQQTVSAQLQSIEELNNRLAVLETGLLATQAKEHAPAGDVTDIRNQLDTVIEEIDKILLTLND